MRKYRAKKALRRAIKRAEKLGVHVVDVVAEHWRLSNGDRRELASIEARAPVTPIGEGGK